MRVNCVNTSTTILFRSDISISNLLLGESKVIKQNYRVVPANGKFRGLSSCLKHGTISHVSPCSGANSGVDEIMSENHLRTSSPRCSEEVSWNGDDGHDHLSDLSVTPKGKFIYLSLNLK